MITGSLLEPIVALLLGATLAALVVWLILERSKSAIRSALELEARQLAVDRQAASSSLQQLAERHGETAAALATEQRSRQAAEWARSQVSADLGVATTRVEELVTTVVDLRQRLAVIEAERVLLAGRVNALGASLATTEAQRAGLDRRLVEQAKWVETTTEEFKQKVLAGAAQIMEDRGRAFTETNKKEVENVVAPFKEKLDEFRRRVDDIYSVDTRERGELRQQIVQLTTLNQAVSQKTEQLTNALTIQSKSTGNWGETILARILEDSGLRRDREYRLQVSIKGPDGESFMPDAVIDLPEKRQLIIDSKVSNKAWSDYCAAAGDEDSRASCLQLHLASLRAHLKSLATKDYSRSPDLNTVDFVLMFVPVEAALLTALQEDDSLYSDAYRAKVILVTPSTLMAVVKLAEGLWTLQKRKESADEIAEAGRRLYEKLTNFAQTFVDVGAAIEDAQRTYEKARGRLATGKGNAIGLAEKLKDLGVTPAPGKQMPPVLLELGETMTEFPIDASAVLVSAVTSDTGAR